ncbi:MAG: fumarate hydratase [Chloroflexi bacterium]|nr:fumarate hydratase [Chloroflexota bacterium]
MRLIKAEQVTETVARLCQEACRYLGQDVKGALRDAFDKEESPIGKEALQQLLDNITVAEGEGYPLCQDTGTTVVLLELGQDVHVIGGPLYDAINEGVRRSYIDGYLRKSIVDKPFSLRTNTKDNTPAVIHTEIVPGENLKISVVPKGSGCENMSRLGMLTPAASRKGVVDFVVRAVEEAGGNPCPPAIICVGIGGTADKAILLSKKGMLRTVGEPNPDQEAADLEKELLERINATGVGPQGFGGRFTALAVHVETFPTHIASLPVAVNILCNSARHKEAVI